MKAIVDLLTVHHVLMWLRQRLREAEQRRDINAEYLLRHILRLLERWRRMRAGG